MGQVLNVYKKRGETPLARLERLRQEYPMFVNEKLSYLGRLDPMAEGVLLVSAGEVDREAYLGLDKTYLVDVLFGVSTDTYDILGKVTDIVSRRYHPRIDQMALMNYMTETVGTHTQSYPPFSSKPLEGKPLFMHARAGTLDEKNLPEHEVTIYECSLLGVESIKQPDLLSQVLGEIEKIEGDFRQKESMECWYEQLRPLYDFTFDIACLQCTVSSGTYMRSLANDMGRYFKIPALAYRIVRTRVGDYHSKDSLR